MESWEIETGGPKFEDILNCISLFPKKVKKAMNILPGQYISRAPEGTLSTPALSSPPFEIFYLAAFLPSLPIVLDSMKT